MGDEILQSHHPDKNGTEFQRVDGKPHLADYAKSKPKDLGKDPKGRQSLVSHSANIDLDTLPEFRLSWLETGSQENFVAKKEL